MSMQIVPKWIPQHRGEKLSGVAITISTKYALRRGLALGCCIRLCLISETGKGLVSLSNPGSFIGRREIFGLVKLLTAAID